MTDNSDNWRGDGGNHAMKRGTTSERQQRLQLPIRWPVRGVQRIIRHAQPTVGVPVLLFPP